MKTLGIIISLSKIAAFVVIASFSPWWITLLALWLALEVTINE
jgi:hypothetical protein